MSNELQIVHDYAAAVRRGGIPSCRLIRLAVERWNSDWQREDLYFNPKPYLLYCSFTLQLKHYKGERAGEPFSLEPWQKFFAANVLGWHRKETRKRRYTAADLLVPRKNGKTAFAASLADFLLLLDAEPGAEVYTAAVDKAQAKLCFDAAKTFLEKSIFASMVRPLRNTVHYPATTSLMSPLSKETKNKDGLNPHAAICDERHAWTSNEMHDVIKTGMGSRTQPLIISISTAGLDTSLPYYQDIQVYVEVLEGIKEMDDHFFMLYIPDAGSSWEDREVWRQVNPNLGVSLSWEYMENMYSEAKLKGGSTLVSFLVKNLNMWVDAPEVWIQDDDVQRNNAELEIPDGEECWVGIDFAAKTDIVATAFFFPRLMAFRYLFMVPEQKIQEKKDIVDYRRWQEQGWLTVLPGKVIDEELFLSHLMKELDRYKVRRIAYDPWGMWNIIQRFGKYTEVLMAYQQSIRYMSVPTKWLEAEVLQGHLNFLFNPVIRWMFKNVVIYRDPNDNIKLNKGKSREKIDGVVASVDAIGAWLDDESSNKGEIYKDHSVRVLRAGIGI